MNGRNGRNGRDNKAHQLLLIGVVAILFFLANIVIGEISDAMLPYDEQKRFIGAKTESYWDRTHEKGALAAKGRAFTPLSHVDPGYPYHLFPCTGKNAASCWRRRRLAKELWKGRTEKELIDKGKIGPWGGTDHNDRPF
jgi:hypothetical protein